MTARLLLPSVPAWAANLPGVMTRRRVAEVFGVSTKTIYRAEKSGRLPRMNTGCRGVRYSLDAVVAFGGSLEVVGKVEELSPLSQTTSPKKGTTRPPLFLHAAA